MADAKDVSNPRAAWAGRTASQKAGLALSAVLLLFLLADAVPKILALPDAAWINNPANRDDQQTYQPAA